MIGNYILISLAAAFILQFLYKVRAIEYVQACGYPIFRELARCTFCLSFWTCSVLCLTSFIINDNDMYLFAPIFCTPLTNYLIK